MYGTYIYVPWRSSLSLLDRTASSMSRSAMVSSLNGFFVWNSPRQTKKYGINCPLLFSYLGYNFFVKLFNGSLMPVCSSFLLTTTLLGYAYGRWIEIGTSLNSSWYISSTKKRDEIYFWPIFYVCRVLYKTKISSISSPFNFSWITLRVVLHLLHFSPVLASLYLRVAM